VNKRLTGILIAVFCLFGLVGISQNRSLKEPAPLYVILGMGAVAGLLLFLRGRSTSRKADAAKTFAADPEARPARAPRPKIFIVRLPKGGEYAVPKVCCSCLGEAGGRNWPATCRSAGWRYSLNIPFCRKCSKTKYPWWKYREPVSIDADLKSEEMVFAFDNPAYAREFSRLNGGTVSEVDR
jgi:hypothetical protein